IKFKDQPITSKEILKALKNRIENKNYRSIWALMCIIILAAGKSSRMGKNKLLLKVCGKPLIRCVVDNASKSKVDQVIVVVGHEKDKISEALSGLNCRIVYNADFEKGQSYSVKVGVQSVEENAEAVLILPGDVALISPEAINKVIDDYRKSKVPIVVAAYGEKMGHPILFDRTLLGEVMEIKEETFGLRALVNRYRSQIRKVEVGSQEVLVDIDTEEDFKKYFQAMR
ncbi:MAG: NTP transferase domain-containing protein, partial [Nitrososphaeria archaeon]|nr:NTP transferase domain-containing protein [Nitrososphaeria archaeon]NIQ32470.1 NTP transferase domain-containing protein [Nitrososphaeria archaeon]